MYFSEKTISVLKNFSVINKSFAFRQGKRQRIMSPLATLFAEATIEEEIPFDVGISDLSKFLSILSLYKDYTLEFGEKNFVITSVTDKNSTVYYYDDIRNLRSIPDGTAKIKFPEENVKIQLKQNVFHNVLKAANTLKLEDICFRADGERIFFEALKANQSDNNKHSFEIGGCSEKFKLVMPIENMTLLPLDYEVSIPSANKIKFETEDKSLFYILSISEKKSTRG